MNIYLFICTHGELQTTKVSMDEVRAVADQWAQQHEEPQPPMVKPQYYREYSKEMLTIKSEMNLSRAEAIAEWKNRQPEVPDKNDGEYMDKMIAYEQQKMSVTANEMVMRGCLVRCESGAMPVREAVNSKQSSEDFVTLFKVQKDPQAFTELYYHILNNSELTGSAITNAIDSLGYTWYERPLLEVVNSGIIPKGNVSSSWPSMGAMAAKEVEGIGPYKFKQLEIREQADIVGIYLVDSWIRWLRYDEEKRKSEKN